MKKLLYVVPLIGLLFFTSCDKDESDENIDQTSEVNQIEIMENAYNKVFPRFSEPRLMPGLYGPDETDALESVVYTYIPTQDELNAIPQADRKYRLFITIEDYNGSDGWGNQWVFELSSNTVTLKFPDDLQGYGLNIAGKTKEWKITYSMYDYYDQVNAAKAEKIIIVNH